MSTDGAAQFDLLDLLPEEWDARQGIVHVEACHVMVPDHRERNHLPLRFRVGDVVAYAYGGPAPKLPSLEPFSYQPPHSLPVLGWRYVESPFAHDQDLTVLLLATMVVRPMEEGETAAREAVSRAIAVTRCLLGRNAAYTRFADVFLDGGNLIVTSPAAVNPLFDGASDFSLGCLGWLKWVWQTGG